MKLPRHPELSEINLLEVMAALNDPVRIGVIRVLSDGREHGWGELRAPVAKSTLSHHMRVLRAAGITRTRMEGTRCFVELRRDDLAARFPGLLDAVLAAALRESIGVQVGLAEDSTSAADLDPDPVSSSGDRLQPPC